MSGALDNARAEACTRVHEAADHRLGLGVPYYSSRVPADALTAAQISLWLQLEREALPASTLRQIGGGHEAISTANLRDIGVEIVLLMAAVQEEKSRVLERIQKAQSVEEVTVAEQSAQWPGLDR